ncbi:phage tail spike protein [Clostridium baratii]|uniref:Lysozyme n=1 Tax=Clostridium baratii TaxID=1561 RepID=A0A174QHA0_9CLOT|nr:phage tail spike protein [Clostridium baratii]CUP72674.1 phage structural protein [Clostridium baratii]
MQYYKAGNSNFTENGDIKLQPSSAILKMELNGICEIEIVHPYDKEGRWKKVKKFGVIKSPVCYIKNEQLFRIYDIKKGMFGLTIKARHIFFDLVKHTILDNRAVNTNGKGALDIIFNGTRFTGHSDIDTYNTAYFVRMNSIQAINGDKDNTFIKRWGGEIFLDNFDIHINKKIGIDHGVKVKYSQNMLDVDLSENTDEIVTRAYPVATDGIMLPEKFVDSPLLNKYPLILENFIDMGDLKLKDKENASEDDDGFETEEELYSAMRERVRKLFDEGLDKPKISGSVEMITLEDTEDYKYFKALVSVSMGDVVTVENLDIEIESKSRCVGIEWDILTKKYNSVTLGELETNYFDSKDVTTNKLDNILNDNGTVNSAMLQGIMNAMDTKFKALRDVAQPQNVRAMFFEDKIKGSKTYGAMCLGSMGFEIASERTPDDRDWIWKTFGSGQGFFADWLVGKLKTVLIENMDGSFSIDLNKPGGASFFNNGQLAMRMENNALKFYNWGKNGYHIGEITALCRNSNPDKPLIGLINDLDSALSIGYTDKKDSATSHSYIEFDKYNVMKSKQIAPIRVWEDVEMYGNTLYNPTLKADSWIPLYIKGKLIASFNGESITLCAPVFNKNGNLIVDPMAPQGGGFDGDDNLRKSVVNSARKLIGKWYVYGGNYPPLGKDSGTDCSGLMQWAYNDNGIKISRTTYTQIKEGTEVSEGNLKPGDLVFPSTEHVFMYSGEKNGKHMCVEAAHTGTQLRERAFTWGSGYRARRIIKDSSHGHSSPGGTAGSKASSNIIYYVKGIEGFAPNYYYDSVGVKTLGYGMTKGELVGVSTPLSEASATHYLTKYFNRDYYSKVLSIVKRKGISNPKQREIDAFSSFAYNLGVGAFEESTLLKKYVAGERGESIHNEFKKWVHGDGQVLPGLVRRREEEWKIFSGSGQVAGYNGRPYIDIIGGSGSVTANGGYGAAPY